jgi:hypothetical protein
MSEIPDRACSSHRAIARACFAMAHPMKQRGRSTSKEASRSGYPRAPLLKLGSSPASNPALGSLKGSSLITSVPKTPKPTSTARPPLFLGRRSPKPGNQPVTGKSVIKLFVATTVGCQGAKNRVFASFCAGIHRKHPTHALQHAAGTTPPSGTPCEFTGRVWEVACCSGKPKWAQDTAKTEVSSRNGTWTQLGALPWGGGLHVQTACT